MRYVMPEYAYFEFVSITVKPIHDGIRTLFSLIISRDLTGFDTFSDF